MIRFFNRVKELEPFSVICNQNGNFLECNEVCSVIGLQKAALEQYIHAYVHVHIKVYCIGFHWF